MRKGEITNRTDAEYYDLIFNISSKSVFPKHSIGSQFDITDGDHNKFPPEHVSDELNGIRYLRSQDLKDGEIIDLKPVFISKEYFKKIQRSEIKSGYILFSIMASVGSVAIYPENRATCTANRAVGILIPKKNNKILPTYFRALFNTSFGETLIQTLKKGGVQQRINLFDFSQLKIPIPPNEIQKEIATFFENACYLTKQKEVEAAALLASIDGYLLQALGITLPAPSAPKKFFYTLASKVSGGRFDSPFYELKNQDWITALNRSTYPIKTLKEISKAIFQGVSQNLTDDDLVTLLKVKNISENNIIDFENVEFVKNPPPQKILQEGDIITPFIGEAIRKIKFSVFPLIEKQYTVDNNTGVIRLRENMLPDYLASLLATKAGSWQIERLIGGGVPFIGSNNAGKLIVPIPPLEKQAEIANHISTLRSQAKALQQQAAAELEQAKQQVERIILGV